LTEHPFTKSYLTTHDGKNSEGMEDQSSMGEACVQRTVVRTEGSLGPRGVGVAGERGREKNIDRCFQQGQNEKKGIGKKTTGVDSVKRLAA